ncbi:LysM peptidoglycan-binding domain-containing protein [Cellvibrio japonicus]|nr:LysM peptidoglycan-binding domain-containing protein [Cellvibrio japonicus]QEI13790.1 LysM peptidoglycan-binding domain-containing protein [Cellvibrio japonicus]QEI17364.1 LysM peptidoglycan-binding domain-containing protein [Cellvibrio japonicus]QEI20940.1 LysM peptidoglycan-binding domain-containing protein [Cellvibrio japonicus]
MKKIFLALAAASLLSVFAWAQDSVLKSGHPDEYTVQKGDTLWDISGRFLNTPWMWPEIWHVNPQIENPHLIYPGDVIKLIYLDGQPRLTLERTLKLAPGTTKLSPSVRVQSAEEAITAIPLDKIDSFLSRSRILESNELDISPYMLAGPDRRLIVGEGDAAYARGNFAEGLTNYGIFRKGKIYKDPVTGEILGIYAQGIGTVNIDKIQGEVATVHVVRSYEEIRQGDRLLPSEDRSVDSIFFPSAPDTDIEGAIIDVEGGVTQVGKYNVVMVNRGEREGLQIGNVLAIYKKGEVVRDRVQGGSIALPDERAGLLMVFRTFDKMSLGLVLEADRPLAVTDKVKNP